MNLMDDFLKMMVEPKSTEKMSLAHGLTILIYLADAFYEQGGYLNDISKEHGFPLVKLELITNQLEKAGLLKRHPDDLNRIMLKEIPEGRWIFEVILVLRKALNDD